MGLFLSSGVIPNVEKQAASRRNRWWLGLRAMFFFRVKTPPPLFAVIIFERRKKDFPFFSADIVSHNLLNDSGSIHIMSSSASDSENSISHSAAASAPRVLASVYPNAAMPFQPPL